MTVIKLQLAVGSFKTHEEAAQVAIPWAEITLPNDEMFRDIANHILDKVVERNKEMKGVSVILVDCKL